MMKEKEFIQILEQKGFEEVNNYDSLPYYTVLDGDVIVDIIVIDGHKAMRRSLYSGEEDSHYEIGTFELILQSLDNDSI